ncbi:hypothetical protein [Vineibacter terrae]|nr:hypothetical protein [Vineibacter terrae]HEX2888663.1 hypothetical protein [Vineibacter terrae]
MKTKIASILVALAAAGGIAFVSVAHAACPPGTSYQCYPTYSGKMSCGCR